MKKVAGLSVAMAAVLFMACDKKENSYNFAQIIYPESYGSVLYADEVSDSLRFATTFDWSVSVDEPWMRAVSNELSGTVPDGFYMVKRIDLGFDANTTGANRTGRVRFYADGKMLETTYTQLHYLDVERPVRMNDKFVLQDSARQESDSLEFCTYSNDWTLSFKDGVPAWVRLKDGAPVSGRAGESSVHYLLDENTVPAERTAVLELTSRGVTTEILIKQSGAKGSEKK